MMLSYEYLNDAVELSNSKIPVLVIENKKIFRQALRSFLDDTVEELFTFSQDFKPFDFNKRGFFISNAIDLDFQNKKLVNKINSLMQKTAVIDALTKGLAKTLAPKVRVLAVAPGVVDSGFVSGRDASFNAKTGATIPLQRVGTADDVAAAITACCTSLRYATGSIFVADGGRHL